MAGIIGLLKPSRCLPPWNKSFCLDVGATARPEEDCKNKKTFHGGIAQISSPRDLSETVPEPIYSLASHRESGSREQIGMPRPPRAAGSLGESVRSQDMILWASVFESLS